MGGGCCLQLASCSDVASQRCRHNLHCIERQCRSKRLLFIILQPLKKQHLQQRSLCTCWSSASESEPSDTKV